MNLGLRIMRRIDPDPELEAKLDELGQLYEIADKGGKVHKYVSDDDRRETELNFAITGNWDAMGRVTHRSCTLGFALMDENNDIHYFASDADKAERALAGAKVTITPMVDVAFEDGVEVVEEPDALPDPEPSRGRKPVAVSA